MTNLVLNIVQKVVRLPLKKLQNFPENSFSKGKVETLIPLVCINVRKADEMVIFSDGKIPHDRFSYHRVKMAPDLPSLVLVMMGNTVCCVVALAFLGFNTFYRKNRYVLFRILCQQNKGNLV